MSEDTLQIPRQSFRPRPVVPPKPSFVIDADIHFKMKFNLAMQLSDLILETGTENKALQAFALQLRSLEEKET